jgi:lipopolysaccharide export system protein LptA
MLKSKLLSVIIFSAFAGSVAAQAQLSNKNKDEPAKTATATAATTGVAVKDQAVVIKGKKNMAKEGARVGAAIILANGTEWNVDSAAITIDGKTAARTALAAPGIVNCVLTGTRGGEGANVVTTLACKSA